MKILIDWDGLYPALYLKFPGEAAWDQYREEDLTEVPDDVAVRWRDTRDAWFSMSAEAEALQKAHLSRASRAGGQEK